MNEQVVKMFELDGKKNWLNGQLASKMTEISAIASSIEAVGGEKSKKLSGRTQAEKEVIVASERVKIEMDTLAMAKENLRVAVDAKKEAEGTRDAYTDEIIAELNTEMERLAEKKEVVLSEKGEIISEINKLLSEMESLYEELKGQGIELNIGQPKQSRNSVL